MNRTRAEIRVGITILAALVVLVGGIMWGKGYKITSSRYLRVIYFDNISGLDKGARVLVNGVNKGKVDAIDLFPEHVRVRVLLDNDVTLYSDARIYIDAPELMGGKVVSIFPGTSGIHVPPDSALYGSPGIGINELMAIAGGMKDDVKNLLSNLNTTLTSINQTVGDPEIKQNLRSSLTNLSQASHRLDRLLEETAPHISSTAVVLDSSVRHVKSVMDAQEHKALSALDNIESITSDLKVTLADLRDIASAIRNREGTVGKLLYEPNLYQRVDSTLMHLDSLIVKFQREGIHTHVHLF